MGARGTRARKKGTGQVRWHDGHFIALEPKRPGDPAQRRIGTYFTRYAAEKALDAWLARSQKPAEQEA